MQSLAHQPKVTLKPYLSKICAVLAIALLAGCGGGDSQKAEEYNAYITSAEAYYAQGQYQAAIIEATNARNLQGGKQTAYQVLARIYLKLGQSRETADMLEQIETPDETTLLLLLEASLDAGKSRSASDVLAKLESPDSLEALKLRARLAVSKGELNEARQLYDEAIALEPTELATKVGVARLQLIQGDFEAASVTLEETATDPVLKAESLFLMALVATQRSDLSGAETYLNESISALPSTDIITPLRYSVLSALKNNLSAQGKTDEAMIYSGLLAEALPGAQQTSSLLESAVESIQSGDLEAARATIGEAVELAPSSPRAATLLATVDFLEGNNESAADLLDKYIDPETSTPTELQIYAVSQLRSGNAQAVIDRLEADVDDMSDGRLVALYAVALEAVGEKQKAEQYFRRSVEVQPDNGRLHLPIVQILNGREETELALAEARAAFAKSPSDVMVQRLLIAQLIREESFEEADQLVKGLAASYPEAGNTQLVVGTYYLRRNELELAEQAMSKVLELGESPFARQQLANIYMGQRDYDKAEVQYRKLTEIAPEIADGYRGLATVLELTDRRDAVVTEIEKLIEANFSNAGILTLSEYLGRNGQIDRASGVFARYEGELTPQAIQLSESLILTRSRNLLGENDIAGARTLLNESLATNPDSERLLASLISLNIRDGKLEMAESELARLSSVSERSIVGVLTGDLAVARNDFTAAVTAFSAVFEEFPDDQVGFKTLGAMRQSGASDGDIMSFLDAWVGLGLESPAALMARAGYYLETEKLKVAQDDYLAVVENNPNNIAALNNLAWAYGEDNLGEALAAAEKAYALAQESPQVMDTYGWFLHRNGQTDKALPILQKALELAPDDPEIQEHVRDASS